MPIAIFLWALLIFIIACNTNPGYFGFLLILFIAAGAIVVTYSLIKTHRDLKWFDEHIKDIPPAPRDDETCDENITED